MNWNILFALGNKINSILQYEVTSYLVIRNDKTRANYKENCVVLLVYFWMMFQRWEYKK